MVKLKTRAEIEKMRRAGAIVAGALNEAEKLMQPGITTREIAKVMHDFIVSHGAAASFLGYGGYPDSACISVNEQVIHAFPGGYRLKEGDIVSVDVGAVLDGYHGDSAYTFPVGKISAEAQRLLDVAKQALYDGIQMAVAGNRIGDIGAAIQHRVETSGYSVVRDFVGHGIGRSLHEDPAVPNYGTPGKGLLLVPGMTIAIEPMVNAGAYDVSVLSNKWTVVTKDKSLSAHFEHTVAVTGGEPEILTLR